MTMTQTIKFKMLRLSWQRKETRTSRPADDGAPQTERYGTCRNAVRTM